MFCVLKVFYSRKHVYIFHKSAADGFKYFYNLEPAFDVPKFQGRIFLNKEQIYIDFDLVFIAAAINYSYNDDS